MQFNNIKKAKTVFLKFIAIAKANTINKEKQSNYIEFYFKGLF